MIALQGFDSVFEDVESLDEGLGHCDHLNLAFGFVLASLQDILEDPLFEVLPNDFLGLQVQNLHHPLPPHQRK